VFPSRSRELTTLREKGAVHHLLGQREKIGKQRGGAHRLIQKASASVTVKGKDRFFSTEEKSQQDERVEVAWRPKCGEEGNFSSGSLFEKNNRGKGRKKKNRRRGENSSLSLTREIVLFLKENVSKDRTGAS